MKSTIELALRFAGLINWLPWCIIPFASFDKLNDYSYFLATNVANISLPCTFFCIIMCVTSVWSPALSNFVSTWVGVYKYMF